MVVSDEAQEAPQVVVIDIDGPGINDVMLGRGAGTNKHEGNIKFRDMCKDYQERYVAAINNYEKYIITMEIFERVRKLNPPGKFIDKDSKSKTWHEVDENRARRKISQALRENAPDIKKSKQQHDGSNGNAYDDNENDNYSPEKITSRKPITEIEKILVEDKMKEFSIFPAHYAGQHKQQAMTQTQATPQTMTMQPPLPKPPQEVELDLAPSDKMKQHYRDAHASIDLDAANANTITSMGKQYANITGSSNYSPNVDIKKSLDLTPSMLDIETSIGTFAFGDMSTSKAVDHSMSYSLNLSCLELALSKNYKINDNASLSKSRNFMDNSIALENLNNKKKNNATMDFSANMIDIENSMGAFSIAEDYNEPKNKKKISTLDNSIALEENTNRDYNKKLASMDLSANMFENETSIGTFNIEDVSGNM